MARPRILILGHGRHGKDTVAEYLCDRTGLTFRSSSLFLAERIVMPELAKRGICYPTVGECYDDRGNHREAWRDIISEYNGKDATRLARAILRESDVYVGMRTAREFSASAGLFDHILWVDATGRAIPEDPTMGIEFETGMVRIDNGFTLTATYWQLDAWADSVGLLRSPPETLAH
jgi:hypothetical protein